MRLNFIFKGCFILALSACSDQADEKTTDSKKSPEFCDCVNKDYHKKGDKEACEKIEAELKTELKNASVEEKGEILMKIQDCKVAGQYDND